MFLLDHNGLLMKYEKSLSFSFMGVFNYLQYVNSHLTVY